MMRTRLLIAASVMALCAPVARAEETQPPPADSRKTDEARPLPLDSKKIEAEIEALQDRSAAASPEAAARAAKLVRQGVEAHDQGKLDAAIAKYREAIVAAPLFAPAYYELAYAQSSLGRQVEALEAIIRALALDPKNEQSYILKGNVLDNLGYAVEAKATYGALLAAMPDSYLGLVNLGICQMRLDEDDEAEATLLRARDLAPDKPSAYFHLATLARDQGFDYEEQALLEQFLAYGPGDARAETVRKRLEEMRQVGITLNPDEPFPHIGAAVGMARALWKTEKHRKAHPEARGYRPTYEEEQDVMALALSLWREQKRKDASSKHGYYDLVLAVDDAGFLDEYIYYTRQHAFGPAAGTWLQEHGARVQAFLTWAREKGHLSEKPAETASAEPTPQPSLPAQLLKLMEQSKVHYQIGVEVEDASARFLEREAKRYRKGLNLAGDQVVSCSEDGDYARRLRAQEHGLAATMLRCHPQAGPVRERVLAQLTGLGMTAPAIDLSLAGGVFAKDDAVQVSLPGATDKPQGMVYWLAKAAWPHEPSLREAVAGKGARSPSVEEEIYALAAAVEGYTNSLQQEGEQRGAPDPAWDELVEVVKAKQLRGFVLYEMLGRRYGMSLARLSGADANALAAYLQQFVLKKAAR